MAAALFLETKENKGTGEGEVQKSCASAKMLELEQRISAGYPINAESIARVTDCLETTLLFGSDAI